MSVSAGSAVAESGIRACQAARSYSCRTPPYTRVSLVPDQRSVWQLPAAGLHRALPDRIHAAHSNAAEHDTDAHLGKGGVDETGRILTPIDFAEPAVESRLPNSSATTSAGRQSASRWARSRAGRAGSSRTGTHPGSQRAEDNGEHVTRGGREHGDPITADHPGRGERAGDPCVPYPLLEGGGQCLDGDVGVGQSVVPGIGLSTPSNW